VVVVAIAVVCVAVPEIPGICRGFFLWCMDLSLMVVKQMAMVDHEQSSV
jgi:hypothetical protein